MTCRFGVVAADGRRSSVWRVWTANQQVYIAPRSKGNEFKISLHDQVWRQALDANYAKLLETRGTWQGDRCFEKLQRPAENPSGLTRALRIYFPDSELRTFNRSWKATVPPIIEIPAQRQGGLRVVDFVFTAPWSRFGRHDWPLSGSLGSECITNWNLANGQILWLVHYEFGDVRGLDGEAEWFRSNMMIAKKLDGRSPITSGESGVRIMISGTNNQGWFCVIDGAG